MNKSQFKRDVINGFRITHYLQNNLWNGSYLHLDFNRILEAKNTMLENGIDSLIINDENIDNLNFLSEFSFIKGIDLRLVKKSINIDGLKYLTELEFFSDSTNISGFNIDFNFFKKIRRCLIYWSKKTVLSPKIEYLVIDKYNNENLSSLATLSNIRELSLINSKITSLEGLEAFSKLETLSIDNLKHLKSLSCIEDISDTLKDISIINCKSITDYSSLYQCKNIEEFHLVDSGKIESLNFLKDFNNLNSAIISVDVEDGDGTPLQGIKYVSVSKTSGLKNIKSNISNKM